MTSQKKEEQRSRYLRNLIREAVINVMAEQEEEQQQAQASSVPPATPTPAPETNTMDTDVANPRGEPGVFTVEDMVDKLNVLRGGKSFTDPEVFGKLTTFFNGLSDEQKNSLDYMLTELGQVVIGAVEQEAGLEQPQANRQQISQPPAPQPTAAAPSTPPTPAAPPASAPAPVTPTV